MLKRFINVLAVLSLVLVLAVCGGQRGATETKTIDEKEPSLETESVSEKEPSLETESVSEKESSLETESVSEKESSLETESVSEKESSMETESAEEKEPSLETESAEEKEPSNETGLTSKTVRINETEPSDGRPDEELQRYLQQATVRLRGTQYLGSGVIWSVEEDMLVIATAAHVVQDNSPLTVQFTQGEPLESRLRHVSDRVDAAFLEVSLKELEEREIPWQTAIQDSETCECLETGQQLWIMGSIEEAADRVYGGSVTQPWIYLEDFDNYMLLGQAYAIPGTSGGGVFTQEGILAGILCGGNDVDQIAALPWSVIEAEYLLH